MEVIKVANSLDCFIVTVIFFADSICLNSSSDITEPLNDIHHGEVFYLYPV